MRKIKINIKDGEEPLIYTSCYTEATVIPSSGLYDHSTILRNICRLIDTVYYMAPSQEKTHTQTLQKNAHSTGPIITLFNLLKA